MLFHCFCFLYYIYQIDVHVVFFCVVLHVMQEVLLSGVLAPGEGRRRGARGVRARVRRARACARACARVRVDRAHTVHRRNRFACGNRGEGEVRGVSQ